MRSGDAVLFYERRKTLEDWRLEGSRTDPLATLNRDSTLTLAMKSKTVNSSDWAIFVTFSWLL